MKLIFQNFHIKQKKIFNLLAFYIFHGGIKQNLAQQIILKGDCSLKIKIFNLQALDNKILPLDNLAKKGCNRIFTTCVLCNAALEICPFVTKLQLHYNALLNVSNMPSNWNDAWPYQPINKVAESYGLENLLIYTIWWNVWLEQNNLIFLYITSSFLLPICKIDHMIIAWINTVLDS